MKYNYIPCTFITQTLVFVFLLSAQASGHAHIFIDYSIGADFEDSKLQGVKVTWRFDRMFSSFIIKQFDNNKDSRFNSKESDMVFNQSFQNLKSKNYFTYIRIGKEKIPVPEIDDFKAEILPGKKVVKYTFFLPLDIKAENKKKEVSVFFFDPVIYVSFTVTKNDIQIFRTPESIDASVEINRVKFTNRPTISFTRKEGVQ